jgi:magnesium-transporting ATPase (P-type)
MLTGDALAVARSVARQIGLGEIGRRPEAIAASDPLQGLGGFAEVFPEDKFAITRALQATGRVVGMTGDGVNDAPALRQAEVGIAVAGATDTAKAAASVVLTDPGLTNIVALVEEGRRAFERVLTWVLNKVSRTLLKAGFVAVAFLVTGRFVISAFAMLLLVFMTDFMKISLATDRVTPSPRPASWNIAPYVRVAALVGTLMLGEALLALAVGWHALGLAADPGRLYTFSFLVLLDFGALSLVSLRERRWFGASRPSRMLALAIGAELALGTAAAEAGVSELHALAAPAVLLLLAYAAGCCLLVNDAVKVWLLRRLGPAPR